MEVNRLKGDMAGVAEAHERQLAGVVDAHKAEVTNLVLAGEQERAAMEVYGSTNPDPDRDPSPRHNCDSPGDPISSVATSMLDYSANFCICEPLSQPYRQP